MSLLTRGRTRSAPGPTVTWWTGSETANRDQPAVGPSSDGACIASQAGRTPCDSLLDGTSPWGSQTTSRPRWKLSRMAPRLTAASGASSGKPPASSARGLLTGAADDVEGQYVVGHPHPAHRDGEVAG